MKMTSPFQPIVLSSVLICLQVNSVFAPVPRCSPFIIINKVPESNSFSADFNPYFPVPECEYGGPLQALMAGDFAAVSLLADGGWKIPRHNAYELLWLFTKGPERLRRIIAGEEEFEFDPSILFEGYSHNRGTQRIGSGTHRDTSAINNDELFKQGIKKLVVEEKKKRRK